MKIRIKRIIKRIIKKILLIIMVGLFFTTTKAMPVYAAKTISANSVSQEKYVLKGTMSDHIMGYYKHLDSTTMKCNSGYMIDAVGENIVISLYDDYFFDNEVDYKGVYYELHYGNEDLERSGFRVQGNGTDAVTSQWDEENDKFILSFENMPDTSYYDGPEAGQRGAYRLSITLNQQAYTRDLMIHKENGEITFYFIDTSGYQQHIKTEKFRQYLNQNCNPDDYDDFDNKKYVDLLEGSGYEEYIGKAKELTNGCATTEQKVWVLHNYICYNFYYDYVYLNNGYIREKGESFWSTKGGVCSDFAGLFMVMAQGCNIPCVVVAGQGHELNAVYVQGQWHFIDCTNDCPNRYYKEGDSKIGGKVYYDYYAKFPFMGRTPSQVYKFTEDTSEEDAKRLEEEIKRFEEEQKEAHSIIEWTVDKKFGLAKNGSIYNAVTGEYWSLETIGVTWETKEKIYNYFGYEIPAEYKSSAQPPSESSEQTVEKPKPKKQIITVAKKYCKTYTMKKKKIGNFKVYDLKVNVTTGDIGHGKVTYKITYPKRTTQKQKKLFTVKKGKITVRKGVKKGTYKIRITAAKVEGMYEKGIKIVTIKVK